MTAEAAQLFAPYIIWVFWGLVIGLLAKRKNLNAFAWGIIGGIFWPVGLLALAFQSYRCGACEKPMKSKPVDGKVCASCVATD